MGVPIALLPLLLTAAPLKLAVLDIRAREGIAPNLAQLVTDAVVAEVRKRARGATVISSEDLRNLAGFEHDKQKLGCQETACLAELGGALGVDQLVVGSLGKLGTSDILDLRLIDARHAKVLAQVNQRLKGKADEDVLDMATQAIAMLFPDARTTAPGSALPRNLQPVPASALSPGASPEVAAEPAPAPQSHPRPLAILLGSAGLVAGAFAIVSLVEITSFKAWQDQPPGTTIPLATAQGSVDNTNNWASVGLATGIAAILGLGGAVLTW